MEISHDLFQHQRSYKHSLNVKIDLYAYATELYNSLEAINIIKRIKEIPQLGIIKVTPKKIAKTRYDYIMLELYINQIIREHLEKDLEWAYNSPISMGNLEDGEDRPTIGDILQLLIISYNIGHFYDTFTSSRAVTMMSSKNDLFYKLIVNASESEQYRKVAKKILDEEDYQNLHLLNSILILDHFDEQQKPIKSITLKMLYKYINKSTLTGDNPTDKKLKYAFKIFQDVRSVSYMAYDLQIANTPLIIDLCNEEAIILFLRELLSKYNNNQSAHFLIQSITKLLDDSVYNENSNAICYYEISQKMVSLMGKKYQNFTEIKYYDDLFSDRNSILNRTYKLKHDYIETNILKLTFSEDQRIIAEDLRTNLEKINNTRIGYYDRHAGEQTVLVSIKRKCEPIKELYAAFKVLQHTIGYLRKIANISPSDVRFLLCVKFFLFYLFGKRPIEINPTLDSERCVICTRGKKSRIKKVESLLSSTKAPESKKHEAEFLLKRLESDSKNDTSIVIPASILIYQDDEKEQDLCEFDGIIIYPMRKTNQVVFLEAKDQSKSGRGRKCLKQKLDKLGIQCNDENIRKENQDVYLEYTVSK